MTTTTHTLTSWLLDRIAEDEAAARDASAALPKWRVATAFGCLQIESEDGTPITMDSEGLSDSVQDFAAPHIARHDPARVLAECKAKRAIVAQWDMAQRLVSGADYAIEQELELALRHLAAVYADAPGYDAAWVVS